MERGSLILIDLYDAIKSGRIKVSRKASAEIRFWRDIDKNGPEVGGLGKCWIWKIGPLAKTCSYGAISVKHKAIRVHRYSWILHFGKIPDDLHVLHRCDNPLCVNPAHLFLGDEKVNKKDMVEKKRQCKGEDVHAAKLTESQVLEIRRRYAKIAHGHGNGVKLAKEFGVSKEAIQLIVTRKNWKHI